MALPLKKIKKKKINNKKGYLSRRDLLKFVKILVSSTKNVPCNLDMSRILNVMTTNHYDAECIH